MSNQDLNKELVNFMQEMRTNFSEVKAELGGIKADVTELKKDVAELSGKVDKLETDVASNKKDIASLYVLSEKLNDSLEEFKAYTYQQFEYVRHDIHLLTVSHNQLTDKVRLNTEAIDDMLADMQLMRSEHESIKYQIKKTQREASSRIADVSHFAYSLDEKISILADEIKPDKD